QLEQSVHQDLLSVKSKLLPQFRKLVHATFASTAASATRLQFPNPGFSSRPYAGTHDITSARPADVSPDARGLLNTVGILLLALQAPLDNIASAPDTSCAFTASKSLAVYSRLLDIANLVITVFLDDLDSEVQESFVDLYNSIVGKYNNAVNRIT